MSTDIQNKLNELSSQCDNRISVFDVEVTALDHKTITLSGRVLNQSQVDELHSIFPDLKVDTASIHVLNHSKLPSLRVATNLTGLYEKPTFGVPLLSELYFGTELEILEENNRWVFTRQSDGYLGWAYKPYLSEDVSGTYTHLVSVPVIELHTEPNLNSEVITRVMSGTGVTYREKSGKWTCIDANKTGWVPSNTLRSIKEFPQTTETRRKTLVQDALSMTGTPYLWGGTSGNGIDCSGFARLLHRWIGIEIPRDAGMQDSASKPVKPPFEIGDLVFFGESDSGGDVTHVGISLGGWKTIHASRGNNGVYLDDVDKKESLKEIYLRAGSFLR